MLRVLVIFFGILSVYLTPKILAFQNPGNSKFQNFSGCACRKPLEVSPAFGDRLPPPPPPILLSLVGAANVVRHQGYMTRIKSMFSITKWVAAMAFLIFNKPQYLLEFAGEQQLQIKPEEE